MVVRVGLLFVEPPSYYRTQGKDRDRLLVFVIPLETP